MARPSPHHRDDCRHVAQQPRSTLTGSSQVGEWPQRNDRQRPFSQCRGDGPVSRFICLQCFRQGLRGSTEDANGPPSMQVRAFHQFVRYAVSFLRRCVSEHRRNTDDIDSRVFQQCKDCQTIVRIGSWSQSASGVGVDPYAIGQWRQRIAGNCVQCWHRCLASSPRGHWHRKQESRNTEKNCDAPANNAQHLHGQLSS